MFVSANEWDQILFQIDGSIQMLKDLREIAAVKSKPFLLAHSGEWIEKTTRIQANLEEIIEFERAVELSQ